MKISLIFKLVLVLIFLVLGFIYFPIPSLKIDKLEPFELTESHFSLIQASHNLHRPFPEMTTRSDNPTTAEKTELGRLLYFDSVLSGDNDISCAHCHHPDLGFSDNRGLSMGKGGKGLGQARNGGTIIRRGSPTIWNTAYNHRQFWDGRALDLEDQAQNPIQHKDEMAQ
ncbi:MAG: cytochrome-c peroxidase, partial [Candidatus Poribacteria bacterium]|nr:cytochrome-c peroxidase [Candidatus Poribacteria bacterium]